MAAITRPSFRNFRAMALLAAFLVVVVAVGGIIGTSNLPDAWYSALNKPPFNPPNWVFGPTWFVLYLLIAVAGWRTFLQEPVSVRMGLWVGQMVLNWAWSPIWFSLHALWPAFAVIIAILVLIVAFITMSWRKDRLSAYLFMPYALWVAFASSLNLSIALLN